MLLNKLLKTGPIIVLFLSLVSFPSSADLVIIVNKNNPITSISKSELGRLFLGRSSKFSDGKSATPINQVLESSARKTFDSTILNRSEAQIKAYWSKMLFSGDGVPPVELNGDIDVLQKVMSMNSAIGYLDREAANDAVKILTVN